MPFYTRPERQFLEAISRLAYANPFLPERTEFERAVRGVRHRGEQRSGQHVGDGALERNQVEEILDHDRVVHGTALEMTAIREELLAKLPAQDFHAFAQPFAGRRVLEQDTREQEGLRVLE